LLAAEPGTDVEGVAVTRLASFSSFSSASLSMAMLWVCDSLEADAEEGLRAALVVLFDLEALPLPLPLPFAPPFLPVEAEGDATTTPSLVCRLDTALPFACCLPFTLGVAGLLNVFSSPPAPSCSTTRRTLPSWAGDEARLRLLPCLADFGVVCADMSPAAVVVQHTRQGALPLLSLCLVLPQAGCCAKAEEGLGASREEGADVSRD
jgi:hypothetical protein